MVRLPVYRPSRNHLTVREWQVLPLLLEGKRYREIATMLEVTLSTARHHVVNIYRKQGVSTRSELLARHIEARTVSDSERLEDRFEELRYNVANLIRGWTYYDRQKRGDSCSCPVHPAGNRLLGAGARGANPR